MGECQKCPRSPATGDYPINTKDALNGYPLLWEPNELYEYQPSCLLLLWSEAILLGHDKNNDIQGTSI